MIIRDQINKVQYGKTPLKISFFEDEVWMTQIDIAKLFEVQRLTVKKHLRNAYKKEKLVESDVMIYAKDTKDSENVGTTKYYNLTAIKNIGHRINSGYVVKFEKWLEEENTTTAVA
jgi:hypothetical protein